MFMCTLLIYNPNSEICEALFNAFRFCFELMFGLLLCGLSFVFCFLPQIPNSEEFKNSFIDLSESVGLFVILSRISMRSLSLAFYFSCFKVPICILDFP